jgi:DNA-binding MarR family transcriptional regulator
MQLSNATYRVLKGVREGRTITYIANETKVSKGTISKKAKELIEDGLIITDVRTSIKIMKLTKAGERTFNELQQMLRVLTSETSNNFPIRFRLHNLLFRIPILRNNPDINRQLEKGNFIYGKKRAFARGWETKIDNETVFYTATSFQIFLKPIWAGSIDEAVKKAVWKVSGIYEKLQEMFPYLSMSVRQELCRQHLAMIGGITIKIPDGFKYRSDTLVVDFSTGVAEIESENTVWAIEVMRRITAFLDDVGREELITR